MILAKKPSFLRLGAALGIGLLAGSASAQQSGEQPKIDLSRLRVSIIAIGDSPTPSFKMEGGKRSLIEVPESEYPPNPLYVEDKKEKKLKPLSMGMNTPGDPIKHPGTSELELFEKKGADAPPQSFIKVALPPVNEDLTIFVVRNPSTKSWRSTPIPRVYRNGLAAFPLNSARLINFSRLPIRAEVMGKVIDVAPMGTSIVPLPKSEQGTMPYKAAAMSNNQVLPLANTAMSYTPDSRINLVAYESDGTEKRQPVKFMTYFELPYKEPPPSDKDGKGGETTPGAQPAGTAGTTR